MRGKWSTWYNVHREREYQAWAWDLRVGVYVVTLYIGIPTYYGTTIRGAVCIYNHHVCILIYPLSSFRGKKL